jgi:16S rRNA G966 N2-methylase RsmD
MNIKELNKELNLEELVKRHNGRMAVIEATEVKEGNWQSNSTPLSIVDRMINKTTLENKKILVIFNLEFLERLIKKFKIAPDSAYFLADSSLERLISEKIYKVNSVLVNEKDFKKTTFISELTEMQFDLVFTNPPYNGNIDLKIIEEIKKSATELVVVHPSTWLIDLKGKTKIYTAFKKDLKLKSVELFNGNSIFKNSEDKSIGLNVPCVITHIDNSYNGPISVKFFDESHTVGIIEDITKFGKDWLPIVKPFMNIIQNYIEENGNVWDRRLYSLKEDQSKSHAQLAAITGTRSNSHEKMHKDDFYTMVMKNSEGNKGIRKLGSRAGFYEFNTANEVENFIGYCKTDFARFCLALLKNKVDLYCGEMILIPWLDFTESWDDEKLFAYFGINQETQDYIRAFLPDYHGIR